MLIAHDWKYNPMTGAAKCRNCTVTEVTDEATCEAQRLELDGELTRWNVVYSTDGLVRFYDAEQDVRKFTVFGQYVCEHYEATIMLTDGGLQLYMGVPTWCLTGHDMDQIHEWLERVRHDRYVADNNDPEWQTEEPIYARSKSGEEITERIYVQVYDTRAVYVDVYDENGETRLRHLELSMPAARALLNALEHAVNYVDERDLRFN